MKKSHAIVLLVSVGLLLASVMVMAHHSVSAEFDTNNRVTFTGVVKKVDWMNPHIYTHVEVKQPDGKILTYRVEGGAPNALFRQGVRPDSLKPGTTVTCTNCSRSKNKESMNVNGRMTLQDGSPAMPPTANNP
jgi:hypothetical protein